MKSISKRALSVLLSVIMVLSIFTIIPFTVSAVPDSPTADPNVAETYDIITDEATRVESSNSGESANAQKSKLYDNLLTWANSWQATDLHGWPWSLYVTLPKGTTFRGIRMIFEHDGYNFYLTDDRAVDVSLSATTADVTDTAKVGDEQYSNEIASESGVKMSTAFTKTITAEEGANITAIKITLSNPSWNKSEDASGASGFSPAVAELEVLADPPKTTMTSDITDLNVDALYKSQRIEWTVVNPQDTDTYKVRRKTYSEYISNESDENGWTDVTPSQLYTGSVDYVTVGGKNYYTVLDNVGAHTDTSSVSDRELYTYQIVKTTSGSDESTVVGTVHAFEDTSVAALRRNSIISAYYGREGRKFGTETVQQEDGSSTQVTHGVDKLDLDDVKLAKLRALRYGTVGAVEKLYTAPTTSDAQKIFSGASATRENFLRLPADKSINGYRVQLSTRDLSFNVNSANHGNAALNVGNGEVHSIAISTSPNLALFRTDGVNVDDSQFASNFSPLLCNDLSAITIGGNVDGGEAFNGIIYNFFISEESYLVGTDGGVDELDTVTRIPRTIELAEKIADAREFVKKYSDFYTDESETIYEGTLAAAEQYLKDLDNGLAYESSAQVYIDQVNAAQELLVDEYYSVTVVAGSGADIETLSIDHTPEEEGEQEYLRDGLSYNFGHGKTHKVTVSISEQGISDAEAQGLTWDGWYVDGVRQSQEHTYEYTTDPSKDKNRIVAQFSGFNGASNAEETSGDVTIREIDNVELLRNNASSNSAENGAGGYPKDQGAADAFDWDSWTPSGDKPFTSGSEDFWHSRYTNGGSTATGVYPGVPSDYNPIWLQTGFDDDDPSTTDDAKLIGGISYIPRGDNANGRITKYEVWVSDYEVMGNYSDDEGAHYNPYTIAASGTMQNTGDEQIITFAPVKGTYVRLVAYASNDRSYVTAEKMGVFEYIGAEAEDEVVLKDDAGNILGNVPATGNKITVNGDVNISEEAAEQAVADASLGDAFNNIEYNYTIEVNSDTYDEATQTVTVTKTPATYNLTISDNGDSYTQEGVAYGTNFDAYAAKGAGTFKYWKDSDENPVAMGKTFNFKATQNFEITAVYDSEFTDFDAYIPELIVSRKDTNWVVEAPVTLFNVLDDSGAKKSEVTDYGIVVVNPSVYGSGQEEALKEALVAGNTNMIKSSANDTNLTNKGRYLHRLTIEGAISASGVYAYIVAGDQVYLSNMQDLAAQSALS